MSVAHTFYIFQDTHRVINEEVNFSKGNYVRSEWIGLHVLRYQKAESSVVQKQIAKMLNLAFEVIMFLICGLFMIDVSRVS